MPTHTHTSSPALTWISFISCRHTFPHTHTHTQVCQSNETGMLRCRQIYKPFSLSLSLSPLDGIGFLSCRHCLSAEALKCHMARWLDSERPAGRRERRWDDGLVKPVCSLYCVQAEWQTALCGVLNAAYCASFSENLGQLHNTFSLTTISVYIGLTLHSLPSSFWPPALTFLRLFLSFLTLFPSFILSAHLIYTLSSLGNESLTPVLLQMLH